MSSRGVFLSMLSKMNVDVAKPLQDLQLELMGKGSLVYLEHKKLMMAQEAAHKKMMEEGMATHSAILKEIRNVESLDDSVYDEARRKRREQKVAASTSLGEASEKFSTVKYTGRKGIKPIKIRFSKKAAAIAQERDNLVMQRNLLALRQEEHKTARAVAELQQRNSDEIAKAKADKLELQLLLKQSEEALREIKVIESRAQEGHEQEISTFTADEEVAQKAHFKRIEEHTKIHLDTLAEIAKAPNLKKSLLKGIDTYFRVMVYALYGYIGYEVLSTMAEVLSIGMVRTAGGEEGEMAGIEDSDSESVVEQDVVLEIPDYDGGEIDVQGLECQLIGADSSKPILRIGEKVYEGTWNEFVGSGLVYDVEMNHCATAQKKITFKRVLAAHTDNTKNHPIIVSESTNILNAQTSKSTPIQNVPLRTDIAQTMVLASIKEEEDLKGVEAMAKTTNEPRGDEDAEPKAKRKKTADQKKT